MKIAIVGLGLIGGSLAKDLRSHKISSELIGVEENTANAKKAIELGLVDKVERFEVAVPKCDLSIIAVPVNVIEEILPKALDLLGQKGVIADMGSSKKEICQAVRNHSKRSQYVACHPMAGTENSGPEAAISGLFTNKTVVICEKSLSGEDSLGRVRGVFSALKMRVVSMEPADHDLHAAYVSHLSHISSFVLANTVLDKEKNTGAIFDLAGGGFESTVRLAKSSPKMWAPIFEQNKNYVSQALSDYIEHLITFKNAIDQGDHNKMESLMTGANEIRRVLSQMAERLR